MKKFSILLIGILLLSGCSFNDDFSDKLIYTTSYPIEYATSMLYGDYGKISSVYPNGADTKYEVTEKKKDIYSKGEKFIYSGIANEGYLARDLLNKNGNLQIIDATKGLQASTTITSSWLDPSNYLMLCSNIKSGLIDYTSNVYTKENIEKNYNLLNEKVSELDVALYDIGKNGNYNTILTTSNVFNYLTKYNIKVISLDTNNNAIDRAYSDAKKAISDKSIQYIYYIEGDEFNEQQEKLVTDNSLVKVAINNLFTLSDEERNENKNYITLMNEIIENYKKELYKK